MGRLLRTVLLLILLALIVVPVGLVILGLQADPLVARPDGVGLQQFGDAEALARRLDPRRMSPDKITIVPARATDLDRLLAATLGALGPVASRVAVTRYGVVAGITVETPLPRNPFGRFVNLRITIPPSRRGLEISRIAIGRIEVPPWLVRPVLRLAFDRLLGAGKGQKALDSVRSVQIHGLVVLVAFRPPPDLVSDFKQAAKRHARISDPETVRPYYGEIERVHARTQNRARVSLVEFVRPVFRLARERSRTGDPVAQNRGAILALALFFGDRRFERLIGDVLPAGRKRRPRLEHVRLDGRHDFVQHFTISAGLAVAGGGIAANLIGEIKEVRDSGGGSGFSFTDIGADRTGVRLAELATSNGMRAAGVQAGLADVRDERVFFPAFRDLPEGMSEAAFRQRYGDSDSAAYRRVIAEIDRRIDRAPLFRDVR